MKSVIGLTLITSVVFFTCCHSELQFEFCKDTLQETHGKVIFSAMVFRHGDRFPVMDFQTNPNSKYLAEAGEGVLTSDGKYRSYKLGQWTRRRYDALIGDKPFRSELLNMISSNSVRVVLSAQLFLAGFYPPTSEETEIWNSGILWQPIPVYTVQKNDRMITMREYCARFNLETDRVRQSAEIQDFLRERKETIENVEKYSKLIIPKEDPIETIADVSCFYDTLFVQDFLGLKRPDWIEEKYPNVLDEVREFTVMFYRLHTFNSKMKRLKGGPLLGHIINELQNKRKHPQSEKLFQFYAGHDSTVLALLDALGVWDERLLAQYCSAVFVELRTLGEKYIVTVSFRNYEEDPLQLLDIQGCPGPCTLEDFIKTTKSMVPEDWDTECKSTEPDYNTILF